MTVLTGTIGPIDPTTAPDHRDAGVIPPRGFRTKTGVGVVTIKREAQPVCASIFHRYALTLPGRRLNSIVLVAPATTSASIQSDDSVRDQIYRALLDSLLKAPPRADLIRVILDDPTQDADLGILARLALALDGTCAVSETGGATTVDLFMPGVGGTLAAALAFVPATTLWSSLRPRFDSLRWRDRNRHQGDVSERWIMLDLSQKLPAISGPPELRFREATREELRRRPWRHGLSLRAALAFPLADRVFVGTINGAIASRFRVTADPARIRELVPAHVYDAVGAGAVLVTFGYTFPAFRGRSVRPAAWIWIAEEARRWGAQRLLGSVFSDNTASLKALAKVGFVPVAAAGEAAPGKLVIQ